jgi:putative transposase
VRRAAMVQLPRLGGQLLREVRRRTRAVGAFPDGKSALMPAAARLRHVAGMKWGTRRYLDMNRPTRAPRHESPPH